VKKLILERGEKFEGGFHGAPKKSKENTAPVGPWLSSKITAPNSRIIIKVKKNN
jgi:hypothetical protein